MSGAGSDAFASATPIAVGDTSDPTPNGTFGTEAGEPDDPTYSTLYQSAWWKFVPTVSATVLFDTELSTISDPSWDPDAILGLWRDTNGTLAGLENIKTDDSAGTPRYTGLFAVAVTAGQTYYLRVATYSGYPDQTYVLRLRATTVGAWVDRSSYTFTNENTAIDASQRGGTLSSTGAVQDALTTVAAMDDLNPGGGTLTETAFNSPALTTTDSPRFYSYVGGVSVYAINVDTLTPPSGSNPPDPWASAPPGAVAIEYEPGGRYLVAKAEMTWTYSSETREGNTPGAAADIADQFLVIPNPGSHAIWTPDGGPGGVVNVDDTNTSLSMSGTVISNHGANDPNTPESADLTTYVSDYAHGYSVMFVRKTLFYTYAGPSDPYTSFHLGGGMGSATLTYTLRWPNYRWVYASDAPPATLVRTWLREVQRGDKAGAPIRTVQNNSRQNSLRNIAFR